MLRSDRPIHWSTQSFLGPYLPLPHSSCTSSHRGVPTPLHSSSYTMGLKADSEVTYKHHTFSLKEQRKKMQSKGVYSMSNVTVQITCLLMGKRAHTQIPIYSTLSFTKWYILHSNKHSSPLLFRRAHCHWWKCCGRLLNY